MRADPVPRLVRSRPVPTVLLTPRREQCYETHIRATTIKGCHEKAGPVRSVSRPSSFGRLRPDIERRKYTNRSEALRDLIRDNLVGQEWDQNKETVATITFVYDHHVRDLARKLTHIQHDFQGHIMAGMHVHLDHDHCLEVLVVKGKASEIREVADALVSVKGVKHGKLTMTTTGKGLV